MANSVFEELMRQANSVGKKPTKETGASTGGNAPTKTTGGVPAGKTMPFAGSGSRQTPAATNPQAPASVLPEASNEVYNRLMYQALTVGQAPVRSTAQAPKSAAEIAMERLQNGAESTSQVPKLLAQRAETYKKYNNEKAIEKLFQDAAAGKENARPILRILGYDDKQIGDYVYSQRQQTQQSAKSDFWNNLLKTAGYGLGLAQQAQGGQTFTAGPVRQEMADAAARAQDARESRRQAFETIDWEGREELVNEYNTLSRQMMDPTGATPERIARFQEVQRRLQEGDRKAGNGPMSYNLNERAGSTIVGAAENIGAGVASAFANAGEARLANGYDILMATPAETRMLEGITGTDYTSRLEQEARALQQAERPISEIRQDIIAAEMNDEDTTALQKELEQARADGRGVYENVYNVALNLSDKAAAELEEAKNGLGIIGQAGVDVAENMIEMGFDAVTGGPGGALVPMAVRVFGSSTMEARKSGASIDNAVLYGLSSAAIEIATEKMFDGVAGIYGVGEADVITEELIRKLAQTDLGRTFLRTIAGASGEGVEEIVSSLLSPLAEAIYKRGSKDYGGGYLDTVGQLYGEIDPADILYDYIIGATVGMFGSVTSVATGQDAQANAELRAKDYLEPGARQILADPELRQQWEADHQDALGQSGTLPTNENRALLTMLNTEVEDRANAEASQEAQQTGEQYVQQVVKDMDVPESAQQVLVDGLSTGEADAQTYAQGIRQAYQLGSMGLTLEQAQENAAQTGLNETQFRHAWEIGAQKAGNTAATEPASRPTAAALPTYESIEEFSQEFSTPEQVTAIFDQAADTDLNEFAAGFRRAYDMGQSGVSANYLTEANAPALTEAQRTAAFALGRSDAAARAGERSANVQNQRREGNLSRVKGTVKGEGVTIADLKTTFNDSQNTAYRLLTRYAETTGVNIVLYNSQADEATGDFPAAQGRFQWKDNTIYIDINSGLDNVRDAKDLGRYTMLRTFAHEFTHFIEKWNAAQYNEFREFVFSTLENRGENVDDLIESMQARDESGKMTYEQASREVVADAMMDILPDSGLVQQLAQEHKSVFKSLLQKMREFSARLKQYYRQISAKGPREAQALKENGAYMDSIVKMWDDIAKGAVANYQAATGEVVQQSEQRPARQQKKARGVSQTTRTAENGTAEEDDFSDINPEEVRAELEKRGIVGGQVVDREKNAQSPFIQQVMQDVDNLSGQQEAQTGPGTTYATDSEGGMVELRQEETPTQTHQEAAQEPEAQAEPETQPAAETSEQAQPESEDTPQEANLRKRLEAGNGPVVINSFEYTVTGWNNTVIDIANGGTSQGTTYTAAVQRVDDSGPVPILRGKRLFEGLFPFKEDAIEALVQVARNNRLLEEAPSRGAADAFARGEIFNASKVREAAGNRAAREIINKMPSAEEAVTDERTEETAREAPDLRGETGDRSNGAGAVRVPSEPSEGSVPGNAAGRKLDSVPAEPGTGSGRDGDRADAKRNGRSRSKGSRQSRVQSGRGERLVTDQSEAAQEAAAPMNEEEHARQTEELHETTEQQVEQKSTELPGGKNFVIGESLDLPSGEKSRYKANVDAIRLVKQLEAENREATAEEQTVLSKYVGWGGLANAFDARKADWSHEFAELRELLTDEEYKAAKGSTLNAHYTSIPVIRAMYRGLERLGFQGGRMMEPASGVGNFVGAMPADMSAKVRSWTMVELDNITGLIAKHLYPHNDVRIEGFEKTVLPDNYMDVAISNVPFGNYPVVDRAYPKKVTSAIHNYFFAKALDKVRPGGIVMFITSSYTMNSNDSTVRKYIAQRADLLGAIRLPNTAFKGNAGTEVVTDILVLKKRAPGTEYAGEAFVNAPYAYQLGSYNSEYFTAHPEMVMGKETRTGSMYRGESYTVEPFTDRGSLEEQIEKAFENITGRMDYAAQERPEKTNMRVQRAEKKTKQGGFEQRGGKLYQNDNGELVEVQTDDKTAGRIKGMLGIRDFALQLMEAQQQGASEASIKALRRSLNRAYDTFVKENGYLNSPANKKAFADDPDRFSLFALENWDSEKKTATKADIFKVDTIRPNQTITHADTVQDAVAICRNTLGNIDVQVIANLTGKSQEAVTRELIDGELAFKTVDGRLEPAETYLSGNVRAKLRDAQGLVGLDKDYQHNVDALKAIVPADIPHEQIFVQPGTPWIPESVYSDFAAYMLGGNNHRGWGGPDISIRRSNQTGNFTIDLGNKRLKANYQNNQEWGTPKRSFLNLLEAMLNSRSVTVTYKDSEGRTIVDRVATDAANEKIEQITKKFQEWMWADEERTKDLEYLYNETFNNLVTPKYDGSTLTVNGLRAGWSLRPHQADAVQRIVSSGGNTLLAHRVGAGKTFEMAAAAMKLKELGIVQKPMFAVPKSLVAQWGKEFTSYFPAAKLLVAEQSDFTPANRKTFANRIATGNYDAIIVSYEQFEKIPISDSFAMQLYQEQIDEIIDAINEAKEESGAKSMSVKDMEKKRKQLEAKIQKLADKAKDTDSIEFEQLGIDSIFVDEAHNFKNLFYTTSMNNVSGLGNKDGSKRAFDLYTKVRYLQQLNGGRGVVFATATPVMNSMSEMYIMQKYLQPDLLNQLGLSTFDAWAKQFGEVVNGVEIKPSGQGYRVKQSFSRFKNMNELQLLFRNFSDVLTKVPGLKIPRMKGGSVKVVECEAGQFQQDYMKKLEERADNIKNVDPSEDNMLKITSDGRKISYTQRMIDPSLPYEEGCKLYKCADNIVQEYKASKDTKGTQIVFCDMATPKGKSNNAKAAVEEEADMDMESAQLYTDLKKRLVKLGIPAKEIAFIHDADTDAKKSKLFDDVNAGRVRVLIGSTGKMGVGMNAQKRAVAIHHLDAPWRPGDVEQRDGRVFRQGNIHEEVSKYVYVTTGSFDARLWDIIDRKSSFIDQIMNGENVGREVEDTGEVTLSAAEVKALASGSPLILEQVQLETDIKKLENLYMAYRQSITEARKKLQEAKLTKAQAENSAANARKDIARRTQASRDESFSITIGNKIYSDKKEAGKVLMAHAAAKAGAEYTKVGSFAGFDIMAMQTNEGVIGMLKGEGGYGFSFYPDNTTLIITNMQKVLNTLEGRAETLEETARRAAEEITAQETMMNAPFPRQAELDQKRQRYNEVMEILNPKEEQAIAADEDEDNVEYSLRRMGADEPVRSDIVKVQENPKTAAASFSIRSINDYVNVQKSVIDTLRTENFFNGETNVAEVGSTGMIVEITPRGIRETLGPGNRFGTLSRNLKELKLATIRSLPDIIRTSTLTEAGADVENRHNENSSVRYSYLKSQAEIDGKPYEVTVTIRKSPQKNLFWIHEVRTDEKKQGLSSSETMSQREYTEAPVSEDMLSKEKVHVKQEFSSAATSLNQVAALFKSKHFQPEDINIDIGGGAYNATTEYLQEHYGTTNMVFDPYNRGAEENLATLDFLRSGNRADTATCANVLNVIKEQEARRNVILEVAKAIKEDGTAYFSVYEKDKSGQGVQTGKDQWQNSRATADYVHEIEEFFDNVERKGAVIIATDPKEDLPKAFWRVTEEEEIEYSTRRESGPSNREILSMAADALEAGTLTDTERNALDIFRQRLTRLQEAQEQRAELGRQYKDQQFTKGGSRAEAERIHSAMKVLDTKIGSLENSLFSLENKDVLKSVLEKARRVVEQQERKRSDESLKRYRERRNEAANTRKYRERVRSEVETLRKWLITPSNKDIRKHVPAEIQKTVVDFLESINLMSKTALRSSGLETTKADEKYLKNMKKLRDAIKSNVDSQGLYSGYADLPTDFIENFEALIAKAEDHIKQHSGEFVVNQMSAAELRELSRTLKTLRKFMTTMNEFHNNAVFRHAYDAGEESIEYLSEFEKSKKSGAVHKFFSFDYMRPSYAFERMGKGAQSIEHEFREGQATQARLANRVIDFAKDTYNAKEVKAWSDETRSFTLANGESVTLPVTHIMSLYCLNKRPQALTHIYGDGIRVANYKNGRQVQLDEGHLVTLADVQKMVDTLTDRQKEVADALQRFMSTETSAWGNYVSMARFDVEQFTEENYFPINSDGRYLAATADETPDNAGLYALLNSGFTKELKENASNRIILYNIFDVFANHTASMTQYRAFALPMLDALKWFNYKNDTTSVRTKLSSAFGAPVDERAGSGSKGYAEQFVINLLRAYNGTAAQGDPYDSMGLRGLHRFNRAQIAFNARVVIQQPMAVTRAAMMLSPAKLAKGLAMSAAQMKKLAAEMEEHSGIAAWKALGFYDTNISRGLTELIKQNPTFDDRVTEIGTKGAEVADRLTWAAMWYAAKDSVKRSSYESEDAYYKAVTELFEDVIYKTQVVDSVLTKSEFLRAKGFFPRMLGSFMSEPMTTVSMLTSAYYKYSDDMQRGMSRSESWKKNGGMIAKTTAVYVIGQVLLSAMQSVMDAWRDDDEYDSENWLNNFFQKYLNAFKNNVVEELMPFGKIPLVSELYEALKSLLDYAGVFEKLGLDLYGNDLSNGWAQYAKYLKKGAEITIDLIQGNKTNYTAYGAIYNFIRGLSGLTGYPVATAWREVQDMWNNTIGYFAPNMKLKTYERAMERTYNETVRPTGLSMVAYEKILADADARGDGNGSVKQDELGAELVAALERKEITEEQAAAIWLSKWNSGKSTTFDQWRSKNSGKPEATTPTVTTAPKATTTTTPKATTAAKPSAEDPQKQFIDSAPLYGKSRREAAYNVWNDHIRQSGMTLHRYEEILRKADTDGNGSLKQDELGKALRQAMADGELTQDQANRIWNINGWKKSFPSWSKKH